MKKILAMTLALALCLCLCACGGQQPDFSTRMQTAQENMAQLDSFRMETTLDVSMEMSVMGQSQAMDMTIVYTIDTDNVNGVTRMEMNASVMGTTQQILTYVETANGETVMYMSTDGGHTWQKQSADAAGAGMDPAEAMALFTQNASSFEKTGTETINGSTATVYSGELDENYTGQVMQMTGMGDSLGSAFGMENGDELFKDLGKIPMTVAIDDNSGLLVRYTMDVTNVMQKLMENLFSAVMGSYGMGDIEITITVTKAEGVTVYSQFNSVGEITVPEAAKAA